MPERRMAVLAGVLAVLVLALGAWLGGAPPAHAQQIEPLKLRVEVSGAKGFNGTRDFVIDAVQGQQVEVTFVWNDPSNPDNGHRIYVKGYELKTKVLDRDNREATLSFVANEPGTFELVCDWLCEGHKEMLQSARLRVRSGGGGAPRPAPAATASAAAASATASASPTAAAPSPTTVTATATPAVPSTGQATPVATAAPPPAAVNPGATRLTVAPSEWKVESRPVVLNATLKDGEGKVIPRAPVTFFVERQFGGVKSLMEVGRARTDDRGVAAVGYRPTTPGDQKVVARFDGLGRYDESEQALILEVLSARPTYELAPRELAPFRRWGPVGLVAVVAAAWLTIGFVVFQVTKLPRATD